MILKEKEFTNPSDVKLRAGEDAEKKLAHYLKRAFKKRDDCFVINDLRLIHDGEAAQIDHLIVSPYGLAIIESKSCHSTIIVDEFNRWARTFNGKPEGMKSPVLQAEEQGKIVKELLQANTERLLGKMLMGSVQRGFAYCPFLVYASVSDSGIIEQKIDVPELYKADEVAKAITDKLDELKKKSDLLSPKFWLTSEVGWRMKSDEAKAVAEFLVSQHQPRLQVIFERDNKKESLPEAVPKQIETTFVPKVGAVCPKCGSNKIVRKSVPRSDGTETDFLACEGYPSSCKAMFPLVAVVRQQISSYEAQPQVMSVTTQFCEGMPCPKCGEGKLTKKLGVNGQPDFWACTNFRKTNCRFKKPID
ncbi:MAG TPA: NERD domain-containing protein [Gallionella sp.]|nr:NERD domain-containing protein [Gallionella sp.]